MKEGSGESVYTIDSATVSDAGTYKCVAVIVAKPNLKHEQSIKVTILSMISFTVFYCVYRNDVLPYILLSTYYLLISLLSRIVLPFCSTLP